MLGAQRAFVSLVKKMKMVDPFNLDSGKFRDVVHDFFNLCLFLVIVRATAQHTQSADLVLHCNAFELRNAAIVQQAREESAAVAHD